MWLHVFHAVGCFYVCLENTILGHIHTVSVLSPSDLQQHSDCENPINFPTLVQRHQQRNTLANMTAAKVKEVYDEQGYLSALPVLSDSELREARSAFAELEKEFGKCCMKLTEEH